MTKTMVSGLLTWLCGLGMLLLLMANVPQGSAEQDAPTSTVNEALSDPREPGSKP